ncbi:type II toxin-antitoxin system HicB family antitoxin [Methylorubrum sp. POS3]|uniref:type II toxin-antitoxin system HicB family antitoxin n=1 Tax=Methylorubrum sp. POS3 TaxID=2998492 RepID=UPI00372B8854
MARYIALIDGEAGAYGVAFPDCPGCTAMGETVDEALSNGAEALREWMIDRVAAGLAPTPARSADAILADPMESEMVEGAVMASVPLFLDAGRAVRVNLSLDAAALAMIDEAAGKRGLTRSAFLVSAARDKVLAEG